MKTLNVILTEDEVRTIENALKLLHGLAEEDVSELAEAIEPGDLLMAKKLVDHKQALRQTKAIYKALKSGVLRAGGRGG